MGVRPGVAMTDEMERTVADDEVGLWVGTYPHAGLGTPAGRGEGVWRVPLGAVAGRFGTPGLVRTAPAPSFVVPHPSGAMVYAVSETSPGGLTAFRPDGDGAVTVPSGGDLPCHLLLHGRALYVSHYLDGTVAVHRLDDQGRLRDRGPAQVLGPISPGRSHAHLAVVAPDRVHLLVADLGADVLRRARVLDDGRLEDAGTAARFQESTGPRHVAIGPDGLLHVTGEVAGTLTTLRWDETTATADVVDVVTLPGGRAGHPAHVVRDGDRVHVSVRGPDVVVSLPAQPSGGAATEPRIRTVPAGGAWPRHFARLGAWFVVAAERSHELLLLDEAGSVVDRTSVPSPASVVAEATR